MRMYDTPQESIYPLGSNIMQSFTVYKGEHESYLINLKNMMFSKVSNSLANFTSSVKKFVAKFVLFRNFLTLYDKFVKNY